MKTVSVNFTKPVGKMKPMHAVNNGPVYKFAEDQRITNLPAYKAAGIPYARNHDASFYSTYGGNHTVDVNFIFPNFDADPYDPASYDFVWTDDYIRATEAAGTRTFYRLGSRIEHGPKKYNTLPPKDFKKWAVICEHIIRHYTEGWADGYNYKITYWEIWNEPEVHDQMMWSGTDEEYFELYDVASKHLKACFPHLKIGGYASCGFYAITDSQTNVGACSPRYQYFIDFLDGFLEYIKAHNCPLDFFSWHSYADIEANLQWATYARKRLDDAGYKNTEHTLNEWNFHPELKGTIRHAALTCGMLLALQGTSLDSAMFYDARCNMGIYAGLFDCVSFKPLPTYYSFVAFGELYKRSKQIQIGELPEGVYACASRDADGCIVMANVTEEEKAIELDLIGVKHITECKIITDGAVWEDYEFKSKLPAESVIFIKVKL